MSEDDKEDIIDTPKAQEFATYNGKNDAKSLEQFVVSILQTNKTMFCVTLAFSIFLYFQPEILGSWGKKFASFTSTLQEKNKFLFITEIFLTAFSITRFLQMINIVDIIMRMPFVCDLIFCMRYEDRVAMRWINAWNGQNFYLNKIYDYSRGKLLHTELHIYNFEYIMNLEEYSYQKKNTQGSEYNIEMFVVDIEKYRIAKVTHLTGNRTMLRLSYSFIRNMTINQKGYFYEKSLYKLIKKHKKLTAILLATTLLFSSYIYKFY
jgi:hypothetical protein